MFLYGLIGYPLSHSFSKNYFTEKFKKEGLSNCRYENFQLAGIDELLKIIGQNPDLRGLNVTIPYKESVLPFLNESNDIVKEIRACNCIKIADGHLSGHNTDVIGFEKSLLERLTANHKNALVLGTGGSAKAIQYVLKRMNIQYKIVSRRSSANNLSYDQLTPDIIKEHALIVNTTPVGMYPKINEAPPLPYEAVTSNHLLFDLTYNPEKTLFLRKGDERGAAIQNGYNMLVYQAEESWRIWNDSVII